MSHNYKQRRDGRSDEQFEKHITDATRKELYLINRWHLEQLFQNNIVAIRCLGLDPTGTVNKSHQTGEPDFEIIIDGKFVPTDVKNSPVFHRCTFKVNEIKSIIKHEAHTLLFINTQQKTKHSITEMNLSKAQWAFFGPEVMEKMLQDKEEKIYNDLHFGYKPCIRIVSREYDKYFTRHKFEFHL